MQPASVGYGGVRAPNADTYEFASGARRFEIGAANPAPHVALREAADVIDEVGIDRITGRIRGLAGQFARAVPEDGLLSPRDPESGLVTVDAADPEETVERLRDVGVVVRALPEPAAIRASIHAVTTSADIERLVTALDWG